MKRYKYTWGTWILQHKKNPWLQWIFFDRDAGASLILKIEIAFLIKVLANRGPAQGFYHIEVIKYVKNYVQLNFYAIWKGRTDLHTFKKGEKLYFRKNGHF